MTVQELKSRPDYEFECNMCDEYKEYKNYDEWGCTFAWSNEGDIGVEYNFCMDCGESCCAIYKSEINSEGYLSTDYSEFIHYDIDFDNPNWIEELENAMCKAMIELHNL